RNGMEEDASFPYDRFHNPAKRPSARAGVLAPLHRALWFRAVDLLAALLAQRMVELLGLLRRSLVSLDLLLLEPAGLEHMFNRIIHIHPAFALRPGTIAFVPRPSGALAIGHIEIQVREPRVSLEHARGEIGLNRPQRGCELLEVSDLPCHQEAERVANM